MKNLKGNEVVAGIDVGSHALNLKLVEIDNDGKIKVLDQLKYPIALGKDTFASGKVSFETTEKICEALKGFKNLMKDYGVTASRIVATSGLREAINKEFILDQIKVRTGFEIDVLTRAQEKFITYKAIRRNIPDHAIIREEGLILVDIGTGNVTVSIYKYNQLIYSQSTKSGPLRLRELLTDLEGRSLNFPKILEEYIHSSLKDMISLIPVVGIKNYIVIGTEVELLHKLCNGTENGNIRLVAAEGFFRLYDKIMSSSPISIERDYGMSPESVAVLQPTLMILKAFLQLTNTDKIYTPRVSLKDGIIEDMLDEKLKTQRATDFIEDILALASHIGEKYQYDSAHAKDVEEKALAIFESLQKLHGLGPRQKFLLQLASRLHDIGKFININYHYIYSYELIMASELLGLSQEELQIVAYIAKYHSDILPSQFQEDFYGMRKRNRSIVFKLVAILRIADALDSSHAQKIKNLRVSIEEGEVMLRGEAIVDTLLEEWTFEEKSAYFVEVFGIKLNLRVKR